MAETEGYNGAFTGQQIDEAILKVRNDGQTWDTGAKQAAAAMPKSGGTFTGTIKAGSSYQSYSTYLMRNTRLASSDTTPSVNGQICWTYG